MSKNKYLITLWIDWYGYDSLLRKFSIEYETSDLNQANYNLDKIARETINEGLKEFKDFAIMKAPPERKSILLDVNKNNKVLRQERRKIGDNSGHNFIYYDFNLIEVPAKIDVDENLFNLKDYQKEVRSFFKYSYKQCQKFAQPEERFIGVKGIAKSKTLRSGLSSWFKR